MLLNSRGRAALREAHGADEHDIRTLKGSENGDAPDPFRVSIITSRLTRGLRAEPLAYGY